VHVWRKTVSCAIAFFKKIWKLMIPSVIFQGLFLKYYLYFFCYIKTIMKFESRISCIYIPLPKFLTNQIYTVAWSTTILKQKENMWFSQPMLHKLTSIRHFCLVVFLLWIFVLSYTITWLLIIIYLSLKKRK
jgi:hypothetical protein